MNESLRGTGRTHRMLEEAIAAARAAPDARVLVVVATRLFFETDDEVIAHVRHVRHVSEFRVKDCTTDEMRAAILRRDATMQRCFDRGSSGESPEWRWFVRASDRAEAMTARIRGAT